VVKLLPVARWLVKDRPDLDVVQEIHTNESLGIACAPDNRGLRDAINGALTTLRESGALDRLKRRWLE
jgi:ABC-type amino acid transport substrate-binding protein